MFGAKNLRNSRLAEEDLYNIISNGRGIMPRWRKKLNPDQISVLVGYVKTLRK